MPHLFFMNQISISTRDKAMFASKIDEPEEQAENIFLQNKSRAYSER